MSRSGWVVWLVLVASPASSARADDPWLGPDKALHFSVSAGLALGGYGIAAALIDAEPARAAIAAGFALILGLAKEVYDAGRGGLFSGKDLVWDVLGAGVGTLLGWAISRLVHHFRVETPHDARAQPGAFVPSWPGADGWGQAF